MRVDINVARPEDKATSQLEWVFAQFVLRVSRSFCARPRLAIVRAEHVKNGTNAEIDGAIGNSIGVDQQWERNSRVRTKNARVLRVAEAHSSNAGPFELKSLFSLAQLRDMLAAEHSTIVTEKGYHAWSAGPERSQAHLFPLGVWQDDLGKLRADGQFHEV